MNDLRVAICIPSGELLHADFAMSLAAMVMQAPCQIALINVKGSLIPVSRNKLVEGAQALECTHMLFLDSDMVFPADTIKRLLDHQKFIVGGTYARRNPPHAVLGNTVDNKPIEIHTGLLEMSRMPTGCLMIHMSVFPQLKKPYFRCGVNEELGEVLSEDLEFCDRSRAAGNRIWCDVDLSIELIHIGSKNIMVDDYKGVQPD